MVKNKKQIKSEKIKKSIKFNKIENIYYTYSSIEYDRTSIEVDDNSDDDDDDDFFKFIYELQYTIDLLMYIKNN